MGREGSKSFVTFRQVRDTTNGGRRLIEDCRPQILSKTVFVGTTGELR